MELWLSVIGFSLIGAVLFAVACVLLVVYGVASVVAAEADQDIPGSLEQLFV